MKRSNEAPLLDTEAAPPLPEAHRSVNQGSANEHLLYVQAPEVESRGSTIAAIANVCNACLGSSVVMLPWAVKETGAVLGPLLMLTMLVVSRLTIGMMSAGMIKTRPRRYEDMVEAVLGSKWRTWFSITLIFDISFILIIYLQLIMDQLKTIAMVDLLPSGWADMGALGAALIIIIPLCLLRDLNILGIPSSISVIAVIYICGDVVSRGLEVLECINTEGCKMGISYSSVQLFNWDISGIFRSLPIFLGAYQCHFSMVPIYHSMGPSHTSLKRINVVLFAAYFLCTLLYIPIAVMGYVTFGDNTQPDIIGKNLCVVTDVKTTCSPDVYVAQAFLAASCLVGWPLLHYVTRLSIASVLFPEIDIVQPQHAFKYYTMTIATIAAMAALAYSMMDVSDSLSILMDYAIAICSVWQVFIIPGLIWNELHPKKPLKRVWGWAVIVLGSVLSCVEVVSTSLGIAGLWT